MRKYEPCCVAERGCTHAANFYLSSSAPCTCVVCGQRVCKECSVRKYDRYLKRTIRVCVDCLEVDHERFGFATEKEATQFWGAYDREAHKRKAHKLVVEMEV